MKTIRLLILTKLDGFEKSANLPSLGVFRGTRWESRMEKFKSATLLRGPAVFFIYLFFFIIRRVFAKGLRNVAAVQKLSKEKKNENNAIEGRTGLGTRVCRHVMSSRTRAVYTAGASGVFFFSYKSVSNK